MFHAVAAAFSRACTDRTIRQKQLTRWANRPEVRRSVIARNPELVDHVNQTGTESAEMKKMNQVRREVARYTGKERRSKQVVVLDLHVGILSIHANVRMVKAVNMDAIDIVFVKPLVVR